MKNRNGFTLVELIIAGLLAGVALLVALPLLLTGQNADIREEKKEAVSLAGDAIYQYVADEMQFAGRVFIGDGISKTPAADEEWKAISVSEKADGNHAKLRFRDKSPVSDLNLGGTLYEDSYQQNLDLVIEAGALNRNRLSLKVRLMAGEETVYEKSGTLALLNLTLYGTGQLEGYVGGMKTTAPADDSTETPLVLWYQSTKQSVNPFDGDSADLTDPDIPSGTPGEAMVLLADPQYVKIGEELSVQFKAQGETGNPIASLDGYLWELDAESNDVGDGSYYVEPTLNWDEATGALKIKGLSATPQGDAVKLSLTITLVDGTTLTDSCKIVVYENERPGHERVDGFVIVPDGMEEEYVQEPLWPIWVKKDTDKKVWLVSVRDGAIVEYSPDDWFNMEDSVLSYNGFKFAAEAKPEYILADGEGMPENCINVQTDSETGFSQNYVIISSNKMAPSNQQPDRNTRELWFGYPSGTGYRPNGRVEVKVSRDINLYDATGIWKYGTDLDGTDLKPVNDGATIQTAPSEKYLDLSAELNLTLNVPANKEIHVPEVDLNTVQWKLDGDYIDGVHSDICRFDIGKENGNAAVLHPGSNEVQVEFMDTAGYSYVLELTVEVPSRVARVEFDDSEYILANMGQNIDGVSEKTLHYTLYDEYGYPITDDADLEMIQKAYEFIWDFSMDAGSLDAFGVEGVLPYEKSVVAKTEGSGTVTLKLVDQKSVSDDMGCSCAVKVLPMEMALRLVYEDANKQEREVVISEGKVIQVFLENVGRLLGFHAVVSLPDVVENALTDVQRKNLEGIDWDGVIWEKNANIFSANQRQNTNIYEVKYANGIGSIIFHASAKGDAEVSSEVTVVVNQSPVQDVVITDVNDVNAKEGQLVVGGGATKDRYNSIELSASVSSSDGGECDPNIIWTIPKGLNMLDIDQKRLNVEVDSREPSNNLVIRLRKFGENETLKDDKIIIRATSASSGVYKEYTIEVLPQFKIVNPYDPKKTMVLQHMVDNNGNESPDIASMEANRDAKWTIESNSLENPYLKFNGETNPVKSVVLETQDIKAGKATYTVTAEDDLTGQIDSRSVIVEFKDTEPIAGDENALWIELNPNGMKYLEIGAEPINLVITRTSLARLTKILGISMSDENVVTYESRTNENYVIMAKRPGKTTIKAVYGIQGIFGEIIYRGESVSNLTIVVPGLLLPKQLELDIKNTQNLADELESGDITDFEWESSNPNIVSVDENGVITAVNPGNAIITVSGRADSTGKRYTSQCEVTVGGGEIDSIEWIFPEENEIHLLVNSDRYGTAVMSTFVTGSGAEKYPRYYLVKSEPEDADAGEILRVDGDTAVAIGEGVVSIVAGCGDKKTEENPLTATVHELHGISVKSTNGNNMINFITGDGNLNLTLSAELDWGAGGENGIPAEFKGVTWSVDKASDEYVDIVQNADGTCTVTATGMGAAYITCTSAANPAVSETFVVIVSF